MRHVALMLCFTSLLLASCGGGGPGLTPVFSPPLGEPSPIVRGTFDRQPASTTCKTDGGQLQITQNVQKVWMKGGFDYGQPSGEGGWEFSGSVDSENAVRFTIKGESEKLSCTAALLEPIFQGTCTLKSGETCDFVFSRAVDGTDGGAAIDQDGDGVADDTDNCLAVANADQEDQDEDGKGDVCDDDIDGDGVTNSLDNCPDVPNPAQLSSETPSLGLACVDQDDDGIPDSRDNCPLTANSDQQDSNNNGVGNTCATLDSDEDGVADDQDNCPYECNLPQGGVQKDQDGDGRGDECDTSPSGENMNVADVDHNWVHDEEALTGSEGPFCGDFRRCNCITFFE